ncbi:MAG: exonuclease subunit SbcD [Spirochaetaceae bacterium]|nr:MAG: exonuclease subunit SbcD [Spirochaetaceae bacterium]
MITPESIPPKRPDNYRIVHSADWHLGKQLNDRTRDDEHELFLRWLLQLVQDHAVDAILVSGDIFDTANPSNSALQRYYDFIATLAQQQHCAVALIAGNHDSAAQLEAPRQALRALNVHVCGYLESQPAARILLLPHQRDPKIAIAMVPFLRERDLRLGSPGESPAEIRTQLVSGLELVYRQTAAAASQLRSACPTIATGHLTVLGATPSDSERDIHIGGLGAVTPEIFADLFDYVALGHLHRPQSFGRAGHVCYAGSPIALSFSEARDEKQVRLLDVTGRKIECHTVSVPRFRALHQLRTTARELKTAIERFDPGSAALPAWLEVTISGAADAADLNEQVLQLTAERSYEVLRVVRDRSISETPTAAVPLSEDEAIEALIDDPASVFQQLLDRRSDLQPQEVDQLRAAFAELLELQQQAQDTLDQ